LQAALLATVTSAGPWNTRHQEISKHFFLSIFNTSGNAPDILALLLDEVLDEVLVSGVLDEVLDDGVLVLVLLLTVELDGVADELADHLEKNMFKTELNNLNKS